MRAGKILKNVVRDILEGDKTILVAKILLKNLSQILEANRMMASVSRRV